MGTAEKTSSFGRVKPFWARGLHWFLTWAGVDPGRLAQRMGRWLLEGAVRENGLGMLMDSLRRIVPDISRQESSGEATFSAFWELKRRALQAFQCRFLLEVLEEHPLSKATVVDIGDSAGTHMTYLQHLKPPHLSLETLSVNLDPRAIEKIRARGLRAVQCRAEELIWPDPVTLFTSFEMLEHLHNPAIFLRRLARRSDQSRLLLTVPFLRRSRVGLHSIRQCRQEPVFAEDEHIFELSPSDWELLFWHAGWRIARSALYFQYPRRWAAVRWFGSRFWRWRDFEGFWAVVLERDSRHADLYQDWEDR